VTAAGTTGNGDGITLRDVRSGRLTRLLLTLLFVYLFSLGATFNGVLIPEAGFFTLGIMVLLAVLWLDARRRGGWRWRRSPLDAVLIVWGLALALSLAANLDAWRRVVMGLWYVGVYVLVWYALYDALANRAIRRESLIDPFLIAGLIVVGLGYYQIGQADLNLSAGLPRPGSIIGNPNALGAFLVVLIGLALGRFAAIRDQLARSVLGAYLLVALVLLLVTFSRGAWLGMLAGLLVFALLWLRAYGHASPDGVRRWWQAQRGKMRAGLLAVGVLFSLAVIAGSVLFVRSLDASARAPGLRAEIYSNALTVFAERPLTGHGLFTFGQHFARMQSQPPRQPHSHAHNLVLHIAAELGVVGLAALALTVRVGLRAARRNWQAAARRERLLLAGGMAAAAGYGVHHLTDLPAMMPLITLIGIVPLALIAAPIEQPGDSAPPGPAWSRMLRNAGLVGLGLALVITGVWSRSIYAGYHTALRQAVATEDYRAGAEALQPIIDTDPALALYHAQRGYLYGLAAAGGDRAALPDGIAAYERFLALEPHNAVGWANLAALHMNVGQSEAAITAQTRAAELAPGSPPLWMGLGMLAEATGDEDLARRAYTQALAIDDAAARAYPAWEETALRREIAAEVLPQGRALAVMTTAPGSQIALSAGQRDELRTELCLQNPSASRDIIACMLLAGDGEAPESRLLRAETLAGDNQARAWVRYGQAWIAWQNGDDALAERELEAARALVRPELTREDYVFGTNIAHFQFLRITIPRQFLPQVYYPTVEPALLHLLAAGFDDS
jgi:putative inorganic carbon (hco3(-)) transporter